MKNKSNVKQADWSSNHAESITDSSGKKTSGSNDWNSVPVTYDKEESTRKHEKTATNNQWCSTSK